MNLTEMSAFVRNQADTDETDAPDSSLEVYARAAYYDIRRRVPQWDTKTATDTLTTTASTAGYAQSGLTTGNIELVTEIVGPTHKVEYLPYSEYLRLLGGPDITFSQTEADFYSVENDTIYLFPTPSATGTVYTVHGYATFNAWPSGSTEPDLPREFDEVICWYMLAMYYKAQEDVELSQLYMMQYEQGVNRFIAYQMRTDAHHPKILGGGPRYKGSRMSYDDWVRRNTQG